MSDTEKLFIRLLRMRTDVGHLTLAHTAEGDLQASFKPWHETAYRVEIGIDPVEMFVKLLGPQKGQTIDELEASIVAPKFDKAKSSAPKIQDVAEKSEEPKTKSKKRKLDDDIL